MREILFRGKRIDNGKWVYGSLLKHCSVANVYGINTLNERGRVIPETVGQYTGLTDENGVKIFEGDYLGDWCCDENNNDILGIYGIVIYWQEDAKYLLLGDDEFINDWSLEDEAQAENWEHLAIIGNIYDNPELLKEKKQ